MELAILYMNAKAGSAFLHAQMNAVLDKKGAMEIIHKAVEIMIVIHALNGVEIFFALMDVT